MAQYLCCNVVTNTHTHTCTYTYTTNAHDTFVAFKTKTFQSVIRLDETTKHLTIFIVRFEHMIQSFTSVKQQKALFG